MAKRAKRAKGAATVQIHIAASATSYDQFQAIIAYYADEYPMSQARAFEMITQYFCEKVLGQPKEDEEKQP